MYILIYPLGIFAQENKAFFSGFVYDDESGEPIVGAFIYNETKRIGAVSNNYGYFSLNTPADDSSHIEVSCLGYITNKNHWNKNKYPTSIYLKRNKFELESKIDNFKRFLLSVVDHNLNSIHVNRSEHPSCSN